MTDSIDTSHSSLSDSGKRELPAARMLSTSLIVAEIQNGFERKDEKKRESEGGRDKKSDRELSIFNIDISNNVDISQISCNFKIYLGTLVYFSCL